jgi:hypothetical protein
MRVTAPPSSLQGRIVFPDQQHLHGPLGLALASNGLPRRAIAGDPVGAPNDLLELTAQGFLVSTDQLAAIRAARPESHSQGSAGIPKFAAVDDDLNTMTVSCAQASEGTKISSSDHGLFHITPVRRGLQ